MAATTSARQADHALASLPARPPTPPKETSARVTSAPVKPAVRHSLGQHQNLQTPPSIHSLISPATTESHTSSGRLRKKVEWSTHTEYKEAPQYPEGERLAKSSPVTAVGTGSRPIKGILKAASSPCQPTASLNTMLGSLSEQISISDMLDSTIKQLSGADRDSKVDAYMALARALKTSNNLPDRVALQGKLSLLTQFIQRDITLRNSSGVLDRSLVNHALLLLTTFLHFNAIASTIPSDFAIFITDHAIRTFEDVNMPKEVVRYLMQVMAFQSFAPKVMSHDRVGRLVAAIHKLESHLSGKSIVMSRIQLYKRLVTQCPYHMIAHMSWLQDLFTDMLSLTKEIRMEAISLGVEAGFHLRHDKQVLRHVLDILQTETDEKSFVEYYIERLQDMLKDRERSAAVPQIWTVVNLFMRCPLERWELYGPWLTVVQTAFNTADSSTKLEANYAWNRYVYLCLSEGKLSSKSLTTLCQPVLSQLRKKAAPKNPDEVTKLRRTAIGGTCNIFYYAFRPGNDRFSPDMVWDVAVQPIMSQLVVLGDNSEPPGDWILQAAKILNGLLDGATPRVWREDRIKDTGLVRPDELPPLDPKWIRRNSEKVFKVLDAIVERKVLDLANSDSLAYRLWQSLVGAVAAASAKDIKVSDDTVKFFASTFGLFYKVWFRCTPNAQADSSRLLKAMGNMVQMLINGIGILPFTEKRLSLTTLNQFEAVATPSARMERQDKDRGVVRSPLLHLLNLFCTVPEGAGDNEEYSHFVLSTFEPFFAGKSEKARLDQARDLLRDMPRSAICPYAVWNLASQGLVLPFVRSAKGDDKTDKILGPEYREIISFLERGLTCHPNLPIDRWLSTLNSVDDHVGHHFGQAGRVLVIIEPVSRILVDIMDCEQPQLSETSFVKATAKLLAIARFPRDKHAMDAARRHLWGAAPLASQHGPFKPFDSLYKVVDLAMKTTYKSLQSSTEEEPVLTLLEAVTNFVTASDQHAAPALSAITDGLRIWVEDEKGLISADNNSRMGPVVISLWSEICRVLVDIGKPRKGQLDILEPLLSAGCVSTNHAILTMAADTWNKMVENVDEPWCSESLKTTLASLNSKLDVEMTSAEYLSYGSGAQMRSSLTRPGSHDLLQADTQNSNELRKSAASPSPHKTSLTTRSLRKKGGEGTPLRTRGRASKRTGTPRLRHDNSQIEFTAVSSSPPTGEDSQHLTERQQDVRERQKTSSAAWVVPGAETPGAKASRPAVIAASTPVTVSEVVQEQDKTTPEPRTSYEDLISSTPTPRRGQVLQMDDLNDPPSSPPEPRPYPLLSEIQTRSRASSSLEGWEFSSPPNSPIPNANESVLASKSSQDDSSKNRLAHHAPGQDNLSHSLPPLSTIPTAGRASPPAEARVEEAADADAPQATSEQRSPQIQTRTRRYKRKETQDQDVENVSLSHDQYSKRMLRSNNQDDPTQINTPREEDTSFATSEGGGSNMAEVTSVLKAKIGAGLPATGSAATKKRTRSSLPILHSALGPQSSEGSPNSHMGETRKRKSSELKQETARKKKMKPSHQDTELKQSLSSSLSDASNLQASKMRTRRSKRVQREQLKEDGRNESGEINCEPMADSIEGSRVSDEAGDTDEELLSQLMAESQAASQSQSHSQQAHSEYIVVGAKEKRASHPCEVVPASTCEDATTAVMAMLRSGKDMLRETAISRAQVDELEIMIMDLKREMYQAEYRGREQ